VSSGFENPSALRLRVFFVSACYKFENKVRSQGQTSASYFALQARHVIGSVIAAVKPRARRTAARYERWHYASVK